jgi:hypothetical protein
MPFHNKNLALTTHRYVLVIITACYLFIRVKTRGWTCKGADGYTQVSCPGNGFGDVNFSESSSPTLFEGLWKLRETVREHLSASHSARMRLD